MSIPVKTIAGGNAGIRVTINEQLYPLFQTLDSAAKQGNHWARVCVQELRALNSGNMKKNVYIQCNGGQDDFGEFSIILPGCRASFRKNAIGAFYIYSMEVDGNYTDLQKRELKPGLFHVKKNIRGKWISDHIKSGLLHETKNNAVVISDQRIEIADSAMLAVDAITDSGQASSSKLASNGVDLHFTPAKHAIGGLRNLRQTYKAETDPSLHESALLLAETMEKARTIKDVAWVSERGGSGVLTQAMRILKEKGVDFSKSNHVAFFSHIQTNLSTAELLARDIGLGFDGKTHSKDYYNYHEVVGSGAFSGYITPFKRYNREEKYTALNLVSDLGKEAGFHGKVVGAGSATGAAVKTFAATSASAGTALAALSGPAAVGAAVFAVSGAAYALYKGANAVVKSYFPLAYKKKD